MIRGFFHKPCRPDNGPHPKGGRRAGHRTQFWGPGQSMFLPRQPNQGRSEGAGLASRGLLALRCQVTWVFAPHMRVLGGASATHTSRAHEGSTGSCRSGWPVLGTGVPTPLDAGSLSKTRGEGQQRRTSNGLAGRICVHGEIESHAATGTAGSSVGS